LRWTTTSKDRLLGERRERRWMEGAFFKKIWGEKKGRRRRSTSDAWEPEKKGGGKDLSFLFYSTKPGIVSNSIKKEGEENGGQLD